MHCNIPLNMLQLFDKSLDFLGICGLPLVVTASCLTAICSHGDILCSSRVVDFQCAGMAAKYFVYGKVCGVWTLTGTLKGSKKRRKQNYAYLVNACIVHLCSHRSTSKCCDCGLVFIHGIAFHHDSSGSFFFPLSFVALGLHSCCSVG